MRILLISVAVVALVAFSGCAQGALSADDVAGVGDRVVTEKDLDLYTQAFQAESYRMRTIEGKWLTVPIDGPSFTKCAEAYRENSLASSRVGNNNLETEGPNNLETEGPKTPESSFVNSCKSLPQFNQNQALSALISATWVAQIADKVGVIVNDDQVSLEKESQLKFLQEQSSLTREELLARTPIQSINQVLDLSVRNQLTLEAVKEKLNSTDETKMRQYYNENKNSLFPDSSYEEARQLIAQTLESNQLPEISAAALRQETICAKGYASLLCQNRSNQNNAKTDLLATPSLAMMLFPELANKTQHVEGPLGAIILDGQSSKSASNSQRISQQPSRPNLSPMP